MYGLSHTSEVEECSTEFSQVSWKVEDLFGFISSCLGRVPSNKQRGALRTCTKWKVFLGKGGGQGSY